MDRRHTQTTFESRGWTTLASLYRDEGDQLNRCLRDMNDITIVPKLQLAHGMGTS